MINFYNKLKDGTDLYVNPNGKKYNINHPFRILIVGSSGSGKTNCLLNLIDKLNCFSKYYLFVKLAGEDQLYDQILVPKLQNCGSKLGYNMLENYSDTLDDLPEMNEIDSQCQNLFVFDDFLDESTKDLKKISAYFTKARKLNCSMVFIGQDYFSTPVKIRRNCSHYIFTKLNSDNDLRNIYRDLCKNDFETFEEFKKAFENCTSKQNNIFIVFRNERGDKRYRHNL